MPRITAVLAGLAIIALSSHLPAQAFRVPVAVFTNNTSGQVEAALSAAIRNSAGTRLIVGTDSAFYRLRVTSFGLCDSRECAKPTRYLVGITLSESLNGIGVWAKLDLVRDTSLLRQLDVIEKRLHGYEMLLNAWSFEWTEREIGARSAEFIDRLDVRCFEQLRLMIRQNQMKSPEAQRELLKEVTSRKWEC